MSKETFRLHRRKARVAISPYCNLDCLYCDGPRSRKRDRPGAMEDFRQKPLRQGVVSTEAFIKIIEALHSVGFRGITLTGGEPLLNPEWDTIARKSREIGMSQVCLTTNGTLLSLYFRRNESLPKELTLLTVSLDTFDAKEFESITHGAGLRQIMAGLEAAKENNPTLKIRTNKVVMRRDLGSLPNYIKFCDKSGVIDQINLLNLILKDPRNERDRDFFEQEFVSALEISDFLSREVGYHFSMDDKYEWRAVKPGGPSIIVKDTNLTLRNLLCDSCPIFCQEGFYTVRVASDGTIRTCIDYQGELPYIDGLLELKRGRLVERLRQVMKMLEEVELRETLVEFFEKHDIRLRR